MKILYYLLLLTCFTNKQPQHKPSILILPSHDIIANEGISPNIHQYLENIIQYDTAVKLINFPYKQLMNVPYQNVFDKKYCKSIVAKTKADIIIMAKIELAKRTGSMATDKWDLQIKIYNTKTGIQKFSAIKANNSTSLEIQAIIITKQQTLFAEIRTADH